MNYFELGSPIWRGGRPHVGLADFRIGAQNKVKITYRRKDGTESFPDMYYISGDKAKQYPTQVVKGGVTLHVIPLKDMEVINE